MALFFILVLAMFPLLVPTSKGFIGIFGGGSDGNEVKNTAEKNEFALLYRVPNPAGSAPRENESFQGAESDGYLLSNSASGPRLTPSSSGYIEYRVIKGDTLSKIAKNFGISVETISTANSKVRSGSIKAGESLKILPVDGFVYSVKDGETAESIASKHSLSLSELSSYNSGIKLADLGVGSSIIIPGSPNDAEDFSMPELKGYFRLPAEGLNWGKIHNHNAVDIANVCGTEVLSSADGLIIEVGTPEENNGGYGGYVLIEHSNGTRTRYAHMEIITATLGEYIKKGTKIGEMGNTGTVHGPTGCHLHFEVYGAQNPFRKY